MDEKRLRELERLPPVNLAGRPEQAFRTFAVLTTIRGSIGGPARVRGAVQT